MQGEREDCTSTVNQILYIYGSDLVIGMLPVFPSTMLPTTSPQNGSLSARDAARHTAGAKRYKYLRRLLHFKAMDFEFAVWQMLYLFTSPQRVYRNFHYRKQTKDQWARDDPAFLVLLSIWLCGQYLGCFSQQSIYNNHLPFLNKCAF